MAVNAFESTVDTLKGCSALPECCYFVGSQKVLMCCVETLPWIVKVLTWKVLNIASECAGNEQVVEYCTLFFKTLETISFRRMIDISAFLAGLDLFQVVLELMENLSIKYDVDRKVWIVPTPYCTIRY